MIIDRLMFGPFINALGLILHSRYTFRETWKQAFAKLSNGTFQKQMAANLKMWPLVQLINLNFVPEPLQLPFMSAFGFIWAIILSTLLDKNKSEKIKEE